MKKLINLKSLIVVSIISLIYFFTCYEKTTHITFLIPNDYKQNSFIIVDSRPNGVKLKNEEDHIVYMIPKSGILFSGHKNIENKPMRYHMYYIDSLGRITDTIKSWDFEIFQKNKIHQNKFYHQTGQHAGINSGQRFDATFYIIGKPSFYAKSDKHSFKWPFKNDDLKCFEDFVKIDSERKGCIPYQKDAW